MSKSNTTNDKKVKKNFFQKYIYGDGGKTLLLVFVIGSALGILIPSLVSPAMVIIAMGITIVIQRVKKNRRDSTK